MASMTRRSRDIPGTYTHFKHKSERGRSIASRAGRRSADAADHRYWNSPPRVGALLRARCQGPRPLPTMLCSLPPDSQRDEWLRRMPLLQGNFFERSRLFPLFAVANIMTQSSE